MLKTLATAVFFAAVASPALAVAAAPSPDLGDGYVSFMIAAGVAVLMRRYRG